MVSKERLEVIVKPEASFYAALIELPNKQLSATPGLIKEQKGLKSYLRISREILNTDSLFYRYLSHSSCRQIFGARHPLYRESSLKYDDTGRPVEINYFNTRILLAFMEVQLGLGFSGSSHQKHQEAIENFLINRPIEKFQSNYYNPFTHQDNVGIHYVLGPDRKGDGYEEAHWEIFMEYAENVMRRAYELSPQDFKGGEKVFKLALEQFRRLVLENYKMDGMVRIYPVRHWERILEHIFNQVGTGTILITHPTTRESIPYFSLVGGLLDMPYKNGAVIVFQSMCGDR